MIRVRVDDFPQTKGEPQHTLAAYRDFHQCLSECIGGKRYLLGVIPGRCTVDDLLYLRRETDLVIGMHGTDHDEARLDRNGGHQFESYMTKQNIVNVLSEAKVALESALGHPIKVYMPPRNRVTAQHFDAALRAGFDYVTTGPETDSGVMKNNMGWWLDSRHPWEYGRTDEMRQRGDAERLIEHGRRGDVILTLHWTWETNIGLDHMRQFFAEIPKDLFVDFDVRNHH